MGQLYHVSKAGKKVRTLNEMFNKKNYGMTKFTVDILRVRYPYLLKAPKPADAATEKKRRQRMRSLRFAATLLTDNLKFVGKVEEDDPSNGTFRGWLRWLTWLNREKNTGTNCFVNGAAITDKNITPHNLIVSTMEEALKKKTTTAILFYWNKSDAEFKVEIEKPKVVAEDQEEDPYKITVTAHRGDHADVVKIDPDEDDDYVPDDDEDETS
jgi:hypothetical protein